MALKNASPARSDNSATNYPKKYWWLILVIVPLAAALIQFQPWKRAAGGSASGGVSGNQFLGSAIVGNVSVVVNEAAKSGSALDPALLETLKNAAELSRAGNHDAAVGKIEQVRGTSSALAALPSLLNNLGLEYLSAGKPIQARKAFEDALKKDPDNKTAWAGLGQLPDTRLSPITVVNYSSKETYFGEASHLVDENPSSIWRSADGAFPQAFVFQLPIESTVSALNFNNAIGGDVKRATKDIEISVSTESTASGFDVAAKAVLVQGEIGQGVRLNPPKVARWIKLRILSNYGSPSYTALGDVEIIGRPHVQ